MCPRPTIGRLQRVKTSKVLRQRWDSWHRWHFRICKLLNLKDGRETESLSLRQIVKRFTRLACGRAEAIARVLGEVLGQAWRSRIAPCTFPAAHRSALRARRTRS